MFRKHETKGNTLTTFQHMCGPVTRSMEIVLICKMCWDPFGVGESPPMAQPSEFLCATVARDLPGNVFVKLIAVGRDQ